MSMTLLMALSAAADIGFAAPLLVVAVAVLIWGGAPRVAASLALGVLSGFAVVVGLKHQFRLDPVLPHFPSGHVALAIGLYGGVLLALLQGRGPGGAAGLGARLLLLGAIGLAEGVSRVALTQHTWTDVAGGMAVAILCLLAAGCPWAWTRLPPGVTARLGLALVAVAPLSWLQAPWLDGILRGLTGV